MKWFYEILYSRFRAPWDIGPRVELVQLVESGRLKPCRAIDLGSGTASNCVFLAQRGFDVTGVDYAQAAIELEHLVVEDIKVAYEFEIRDWKLEVGSWKLEIGISNLQSPITISPAPVIRAIVNDYRKRVPPWVIASKFHNAVALMLREVAVTLREREGLNRVALSGGVFQNITLLTRAMALLRESPATVQKG